MSRSPPRIPPARSRSEIEQALATAKTQREFDAAVIYLRQPGAFSPEDRQALDVFAEQQARRFATPEQRARGQTGLSGRSYRFSFRNVKREVG